MVLELSLDIKRYILGVSINPLSWNIQKFSKGHETFLMFGPLSVSLFDKEAYATAMTELFDRINGAVEENADAFVSQSSYTPTRERNNDELN